MPAPPEDEEDGQQLIIQTIRDQAERYAADAAARHTERFGRRRVDWDVRGLLALLALLGAFALAFAQLVYRGDANIPAWAATTVGAVVGFYFGGRGGTSNGHGDRRKDDP
jgi:hypothetical protein